MKDRYLCKAKRIDNGEWVKGYYSFIDNVHYIYTGALCNGGLYVVAERFEIDPSTVCLYVELTDMNIVNIWENNIYQWVNNTYGTCTGIVRFGKYLQDGSGGEYSLIPCYGFYVEVIKYEPYPDSYLSVEDYPGYLKAISVLELFNSEKNSAVEFIGNIFDNPELLEGDQI